MQKIIWSCGLALFCLATSLAAAVPPPSPPATATTPPTEPVDVLAAAKQAGVLRVAMEPDFPPPCIGLTKKARKTVLITT